MNEDIYILMPYIASTVHSMQINVLMLFRLILIALVNAILTQSIDSNKHVNKIENNHLGVIN